MAFAQRYEAQYGWVDIGTYSGGRYGQGIGLFGESLCSAHPRFWTNAPHPVRKARNKAEILADVLLADQPHKHNAARRDRDCMPKKSFQHEDAFCMVPQCAMSKIGCQHF